MKELDNYHLRIDNIMKKYRNMLLNNYNIIGFGRGRKIINGHFTKEPCLTVYVAKKLSKNSLNPQDFIPQYFNGSPTDIIEVNGPANLFYDKVRPAVGGLNIGNVNNDSSGTLTCALSEKGEQKRIYLLSCSHVLTRKAKELIFNGTRGDIIVQPESSVNDIEKNKIGKLADIAPIYRELNKPATKGSKWDSAIAYVGMNTKENQKILAPGIKGGYDLAGVKTIDFESKIARIGCVTGEQIGRIISTGRVYRAKTKLENTSDVINILYEDIIVADMKSEHGDSGGLGIVKNINGYYATGIFVGGTTNVAVFSSLINTLDYFNLDLLKPLK